MLTYCSLFLCVRSTELKVELFTKVKGETSLLLQFLLLQENAFFKTTIF